MTPEQIHKEAIKEWETIFSNLGGVSPYDAEFSKKIRAIETECENEAHHHLQPWLRILEDCIQWLANLASIFDELNNAEKLTRSQQAVWALIGASCAFAIAVRRLVLSGLDTPAKAAARSLDEHLCACVVFLRSQDLAAEFHQCHVDSDVANFWFRNLSPKALKKHLNAVEREIGFKQEMSENLRMWREEEVAVFSQAVHPSYVSAALASISLTAKDINSYGTAFLGRATAFSERTLEFSCKSIWYFSNVGLYLLFKDRELCSVIEQLPKSERRLMAIIGREAIRNLVRKYWRHEIYPRNSE